MPTFGLNVLLGREALSRDGVGCKGGCGYGMLLAGGALQLCKSSVWVAVLGATAPQVIESD